MARRASDHLQVADNLSLDADFIAGGSLALLGKRGAGKSFATRVLAEELFDAGVQLIMVDPMGVFWGLRSSADGNHDGLPIPVFGGQHADAPLEPTAGALMADLAVNEGLSMILDLSGFTSRHQERSFAAAFFDGVYRKATGELLTIAIDEIDLFAPQNPRGQDAPLLATVENIIRRGRNKGIGAVIASQRPQVIHKDVLSQVDGVAVLRLTAPQDREAIRNWVKGQGDEDQWASIAPSLPGLATGESWWWIPEKQILQRTQVRQARTFDSSSTRKRGQRSRVPKTFADVDLAAISDRIAATIERAKEHDPRELHRRIADLDRQLAAVRRELAEARRAVPAPVAVPVVDADLVERLEKIAGTLGQPAQELAEVTDQMHARLQEVAARLVAPAAEIADVAASITTALHEITDPSPGLAPAAPPAAPPDPAPAGETPPIGEDRPAAPAREPAADPAVTPARQRILDSLAALEGIGVGRAPKVQLALWAGVSPKSSGYANNLGALRTAGLVDYPAGGYVTLTEAGRGLTDRGGLTAAMTVGELHRHVEGLVAPARWRILRPLLEAYPAAISKTELAEQAGVSPTSSGYANNLGALRSLGLLDYPRPGEVAATSVLFLYG